MTDFVLLENVYLAPYLGSLFQRPKFFKMHSGTAGIYFEWERKGKAVASIHFTPDGAGLWRSPAKGTFGGFSWASGLHLEDLFAFHDAVLRRLAQLGARAVEVLPAPAAHDPEKFANQVYMLSARGYDTTRCDVNHSLMVDARDLAERMSYGNLKRLRKCRNEGLIAQRLPPSDLDSVYETLVANREGKGNTLSMSLVELHSMRREHSDSLLLFGCPDGPQLAAAALCLSLNGEILYVFAWGDRPGHSTASPVVSVADCIYRYCQSVGVQLLDVGTSTVGQDTNFGLVRFKRGLGFTESLKLRLVRTL